MPVKLGFQFVPFPLEIWSENINLTQAEFRLLGWFCYNLKFGIAQITASDYQILKGFKNDDSVYPSVGLSKNSLRRARIGLVERKMLLAHQTNSGGGRGNEVGWSYSLNLSNSDKFSEKQSQTLPTLTLNPPNFDPKPSQLGPPNKEREESEEPELKLSPPSASDGQSKKLLQIEIDIPKLFEYFCQSSGKSKNYTLTDKRRKMAERRWGEALKIAKGDVAEAKMLVKRAVDGLCENQFMREKGLLEWDQVFRSEDNFSKWLDRYENEVA